MQSHSLQFTTIWSSIQQKGIICIKYSIPFQLIQMLANISTMRFHNSIPEMYSLKKDVCLHLLKSQVVVHGKHTKNNGHT